MQNNQGLGRGGAAGAERPAPCPALPCLLVTTQSEAVDSLPGRLPDSAVIIGQKSKLAKKAESLSLNVHRMVELYGIERVAFVTLTFRQNLRCFRTAQKRFNSLASNVLRDEFQASICAVHRQRRGAIHYHLIVATKEDIRTGFDFESWRELLALTELFGRDHPRCDLLAQRVFRSANPALRAIWSMFRSAGPRFGFGRIETYPVRSNSEAVARYVGSYVRVGAENRELRDKGMRTIRYSLPGGQRVATARFSWVDGPGRDWRRGCALFSALTGVTDFQAEWGSRWARHFRFDIGTLGRWADRIGETFFPFLEKLVDVPKEERIKETMALVRYLREREEKEMQNGDATASHS